MQKIIEKKIKRIFNLIAKTFLGQLPKEPNSHYNRILIIRPGGIGDMILSVPVLSSIRMKFPNSIIDLLCESRNTLPLKGLELIDNIYIFDKKPYLILKLVKNL